MSSFSVSIAVTIEDDNDANSDTRYVRIVLYMYRLWIYEVCTPSGAALTLAMKERNAWESMNSSHRESLISPSSSTREMVKMAS